MKEDHSNFQARGRFVLDLVLVVLAFVVAYHVKRNFIHNFSGLSTGPNYYLVLLCCLLSSAVAFDLLRLSSHYKLPSIRGVVFKVVRGVLTSMVGLVFMLYIFKMADVSRLLLTLYFVLLVCLMMLSRYLVIKHQRHHFKNQSIGSQVLIVGSCDRAKELIQYLDKNQRNDCHIIGCFETIEQRAKIGSTVFDNVKVLGVMAEFEHFLVNNVVDEVIFAMPLKKIKNALEYVGFAETVGVNVRILPDWQLQKMMYQPEVGSVAVENFVGIPTLVLSSIPKKNFELVMKSLFDRSMAFISLVILSPLFLAFAVAIKISSRGPIFFRQVRSGLNGREFTLYKFRTMVEDAEALKVNLLDDNEMDGPVFKIKHDPRITKIGNILRKTSLDELPQLINIAKGEMSIVGPRPPLPCEVAEYAVWQRRRLSMKPGLTCTWQVSGRNEISFEQWMTMDLDYIDKWSLMTDMKLILKTFPAVVFGTGR